MKRLCPCPLFFVVAVLAVASFAVIWLSQMRDDNNLVWTSPRMQAIQKEWDLVAQFPPPAGPRGKDQYAKILGMQDEILRNAFPTGPFAD